MEVYKKRFKDNFDYFLKRGVFSQGCLHWVCKNNSFLAFDVENERFRDMPSTRVPESGRKIRYFGDLGGRLHVIREYGGTPLVDVMELKIDYSEWSLKYRVDIVGLGRRIGGNAGRIEIDILCLVEATGEGKIMLIVSGQGRIFAYDIIGRTFEESNQRWSTTRITWTKAIWYQLCCRGTLAICNLAAPYTLQRC
ncbi:uncharacterized protein LOC132603305 isoform X3 [Lycium barbarum]|uniref:uncharacterized protein LOC132603305 isoform X3 n=1 Tax=Lycium barbarum TaxID=112863 RepID=UPI00293EB106|nr:uncharacterized protein LOC132603305 isoform X3 [Lycium barbarum]